MVDARSFNNSAIQTDVDTVAISMPEVIIAPSTLGYTPTTLEEHALSFYHAGAAWLHWDVMDGIFVPACVPMLSTLEALRPKIPSVFDVHLMVRQPVVMDYIKAGADFLTLHPEAFTHKHHVTQALDTITSCGKGAGLALYPGAAWQQWPCAWWSHISLVLVMSVVPGKGGQPFQPAAIQVSKTLCHYVARHHPHVRISVDGGITPETLCLVPWVHVAVSGSYLARCGAQGVGHLQQAWRQARQIWQRREDRL